MALEHRKITKKIVGHHSASPASTTKEQVDQWHKAKGFEMIGYHYFIEQDGTVKQGRPDWAVGAHALGANQDSIGICLAGNFEQEPPTPAQIKSLIATVAKVRIYYGDIPFIGHREVDPVNHPTACPGKLFPMDEVKRLLEVEPVNEWEAKKQGIMLEAKNKGLISGEHNPDDPASKWFVLQVALNVLRKMGGK